MTAYMAPPATPHPPLTADEIAAYEALPTDIDPEYASLVALGFALILQDMGAAYLAEREGRAA